MAVEIIQVINTFLKSSTERIKLNPKTANPIKYSSPGNFVTLISKLNENRVEQKSASK